MGRDEAGNLDTLSSSISSMTKFRVPVVTSLNVSAAMSIPSSTLPFIDGGLPASIGASVTSLNASIAAVRVAFFGVNSPTYGSEVVTGVNATISSYSTYTAMSTLSTNYVGTESLVAASWNNVSVSDVSALIAGLNYTNTNPAPVSGRRMVYITLSYTSNGQEYLVATASRAIVVTVVDSPPVLSGTSLTNLVTWIQGSSDIAVVSSSAGAFSIADSDDVALTKAYLTIVMTNSTGNYGPCDQVRDALYLPSSYNGGSAPTVIGRWDASTCTINLSPLSATSTTVPIADMALAIKSVKYTNLGGNDPLNAVPPTANSNVRKISIQVYDNAANGAVTTPLASSSVNNYVLLQLNTTSAPTVVDYSKIYAENGMFYWANASANIREIIDPVSGLKYRQYKTSFVVDGSSSATTFQLPIDLSKQRARYFGALGAIYVADKLDPITDGSLITFSPIVGTWPSALQIDASLAGSSSSYNVSGLSYLGISLTTQASALGEIGVNMTYGNNGPSILFYFDVRIAGCTLRANSSSPAVSLSLVYPSPSLCYAILANSSSSVVSVASGQAAVASSVDYSALTQPALTISAALIAAGGTLASQIAAAASVRLAARSQFALNVSANSFSASTGTLTLDARPIDSKSISLVPSPPSSSGQLYDLDIALKLGPAGQTFTKPVKVCIFVGNTPAGYTRILQFSSQVDPTDVSRGYTSPSTLGNIAFDAISGSLCGETTHFSLAIPVLVPFVPSPTVPKQILLGGTCPNSCSGRGFCQVGGVCSCYAGSTGYDCSLLACPSAPSWDVGSGNIAHAVAECSSRGTCDSTKGVCRCDAGFEGSACQRLSCPSTARGVCSGNGKCRLVSELSNVKKASYSSWENAHVQVCQCDGGFTGHDCSQRVCPFGNDIEVPCNSSSTSQTQRVTLSFGTIPTSLLPHIQASVGPFPSDAYVSDEFALQFTGMDNTVYTTSAISDILLPSSGTQKLKTALLSLPDFAVSSVDVTSSTTSTSVSYDVTFTSSTLAYVTANSMLSSISTSTVAGNQQLLSCPFRGDNSTSMGCTVPGCKPLFHQTRLLQIDASNSLNPGISVSSTAVLMQPAPLNAGDDALAGKWGVIVTITVSTITVQGSPVKIYSVSSSIYESGAGQSLEAIPVPPVGLRNQVKLPYGLRIDFDPLDSNIPDQVVSIKWRLPTCSVKVVQAADSSLSLYQCSRRGNCDSNTGKCTCFKGYSGYNCGQQSVVL
jgi:EGF-like domain